MKITIIGIITIILSIIAFFRKNDDELLWLVVFFSTFTAATVLNPTIKVIIPFKIPMFLWIIRQLLLFIKTKPKITRENILSILRKNKIFTALLILSICIVLSVGWLYITKLNIPYFDNLYKEDRVIQFGKENISQTLGILVYIGFAMLLSLRINDRNRIEKILRVFAISSCFAIVWGFIQFIIYYLQIDYPAFLFNNNDRFAQGYDQIIHGIKRISSISTEPSTFSLNILGFIPLILIPVITNNESENKKTRIIFRIILVLTLVCGILTTSSTALTGITVIMLTLLIYYIKCIIRKENVKQTKIKICKVMLYSIISISIAIIIAIIGHGIYVQKEMYVDTEFESEFQEDEETPKKESSIEIAFMQMTISKLSNGSGAERIQREAQGFNLFKNSVLFGLGFGSFRTFTIETNMLINTGIIGFISIIYIWIVVFKTILKNREKNKYMANIFSLSLFGMTIALIISVPDLIYMYYWIILVLSYKYFENKPKELEQAK